MSKAVESIGKGMVGMGSMLSKIDKSKLEILEKPLRPRKNFFSEEEKPLEKGSVIVMPVTVMNTERFCFQKVDFGEAKAKDGSQSIVFKAYLTAEHFTDEWVAQGHKSKGIVCFCEHKLPEDLSGFEVMAKTKDGKAAFVKPIGGGMAKAIENYRIKDVVYPEHAGVRAQ